MHEQTVLELLHFQPLRIKDQKVKGAGDMNVCAECGQIYALSLKDIEQCIKCLNNKKRNPRCLRFAQCIEGKDKTCNSILEDKAKLEVKP